MFFYLIPKRKQALRPFTLAKWKILHTLCSSHLGSLLVLGIALGGTYAPLASQSDLEKINPSPQNAAPKRMAWTRPQRALYEINFGRSYSGHTVIYFNELEAWARNRNLLLLPDLALRGLQNFEAVLIPASGLRFKLDAPTFSRVYLYLDLATYKSLEKKNLGKTSLSWLEVIVNGYSLKIVYQGAQAGRFIQSPLVIPVELEQIPEGKLQVFLRPAPHETRFAIWDAFVSSYPSPK